MENGGAPLGDLVILGKIGLVGLHNCLAMKYPNFFSSLVALNKALQVNQLLELFPR